MIKNSTKTPIALAVSAALATSLAAALNRTQFTIQPTRSLRHKTCKSDEGQLPLIGFIAFM